MMGIFSTALAGLLSLADPETIVITTGPHSLSPKYHQTDYESSCGSNVFRVRFRNGPDENGRVDHAMIDNQPVPGAAEMLDLRAARRWITGVEILNCEADRRRSILRGTINFEPADSRRLGMRWTLAFRLTREGRDSWRMTID
jgi:hypothetical protein